MLRYNWIRIWKGLICLFMRSWNWKSSNILNIPIQISSNLSTNSDTRTLQLFVEKCTILTRLTNLNLSQPHYSDIIMGAIASQITSLAIVYSTVYSDADQRKHQSSALLAFVRGIHRWPVNSPHKWPVTRKMFPFDDVIMASPDMKNLPESNRPKNDKIKLLMSMTQLAHETDKYGLVRHNLIFKILRMTGNQFWFRSHSNSNSNLKRFITTNTASPK